MDQNRQRIQDDLRGLLRGDVFCDDIHLQLYASDASIYQIKPLGIVRPRSTSDVAVCLNYAAAQQIPITARGAGTGLAGESLGEGLVLDFSRYMRRILATDPASVRVQPGVVLSRLNEHLARFGQLFGPDPAMSRVTTMGSVISIDASGSRWMQYGSARRHIESLQIVLADGEVMEVGREPLFETDPKPEDLRKRQLVDAVADLLSRRQRLIERYAPRALVNQCGYQLSDVLTDTHLDLARLLCGSEGTLAIVTEATLTTEPISPFRGVGLLFFDSLENASLAVQEILPFKPTACDLLDRRHLSLAREADVCYELLVPGATEALLLVEHAGATKQEVRERLIQTTDHVRRKRRLAFDTHVAFDLRDQEICWQLARGVTPTLHRLKGATRPLAFIEDVAVPPDVLPDFLVQLQNILKRHQVTATLYGHVGHGQLHVRPFLDLSNEEDVSKLTGLAEDLYRETLAVGGTISGEHGDGISRTPFIREQYGELYSVFAELKQIFDPLGILNPGKIVSVETSTMQQYLRPTKSPEVPAESEAEIATAPPKKPIELQLNWSLAQLTEEAASCNGCGSCRSQQFDVRMCPIFKVAPAEEASPRAKANLLRAIAVGELSSEYLPSEDVKQIADLCIHCHQCRLECPANVDIPRLMIETKSQYVTNNGLRPSDWILSRLDWVSSWGSTLSPVSNWVIGNRTMRWLLEKSFGIARGRKLPRFAPRSFMRWATRRKLTRPTRRSDQKVLYFVDTYANYVDPKLGEALVSVFEHNGVAVYVHPQQRSSGMAMYSMGVLDPVRRLAEHNIPLLAEAVRQGYQIVVTEPSTALCLTHEYLTLMDDEDARLVAENTTEACHYLWKMHLQGKLQLDLKPVNASLAYHMPCHLKALQVGSPGENLLRLISGLQVQRVEKGCSGMAGTYGLKKENFRTSLRAGWGLISSLRDPTFVAGTTECGACKMQMEQGAAKPTVHPLKILSLSYGLMPELAASLSARSEELYVS
ncbi:MAG: anaerobic glycerol-3-phosphate dehydrogenase subunit C [Planctomycetota bacterium]|nr:anaerobic glycerol-3-phosphate dehydrogenase subunit C [Planctomycetota bacterium]